MGERSEHAPGTFSWADLATSDTDAAKSFYTALFGWDTQDHPVPGGGVYTICLKGGKDVAALSGAQDGQPPAWNSYVTVAGADEGADAARGAGGTVAMEPFDVTDVGRMAVIQDPTGAFFCIWEPRANVGAKRVNEPGALTLNQLNSSNPEGAQEFYTGVFGWRFERVSEEPAYWGIYNGERLNGGMMEQSPSAWLVYFGSEDVDAGRIAELGGTVVVEPMSVPGGRILVAEDTQGAYFGLLAGRFDD